MYCMKGKWRVNGKAHSTEFSPVYPWVASALLLPFYRRRHLLLCFCICGHCWALFKLSAWHTPATAGSVLNPASNTRVIPRNPCPSPAHWLCWARWSDTVHDMTLPSLLLWQSLITAGKTSSKCETALSCVMDCFGSWPSPDL